VLPARHKWRDRYRDGALRVISVSCPWMAPDMARRSRLVGGIEQLCDLSNRMSSSP
jgi:hypothetical protein